MKTKIFISVIAAMLFMVNNVAAQQNRIALGSNSYKVSNTGKYYALEVNGKQVTEEIFSDINTTDDKYFIVELYNNAANETDFGLVDATGKFVFKCNYGKISTTGSFIAVYEELDSKPVFYSKENPSQKVDVTETSVTSLEDEIDAKAPANTTLNPTRIMQKNAEEAAKEFSKKAPFGAFEIRTNTKGSQELVVDGKVLYTSKTFVVLSDADFFLNPESGGCIFFIVEGKDAKGRNAYGVYIIAIYSQDGKKMVEQGWGVPCEYKDISVHQGTVVECLAFNYATKYFYWNGEVAKP